MAAEGAFRRVARVGREAAAISTTIAGTKKIPMVRIPRKTAKPSKIAAVIDSGCHARPRANSGSSEIRMGIASTTSTEGPFSCTSVALVSVEVPFESDVAPE